MNSMLRWVTILKGEGAILEEHVPDKPNTPNNCELDWCQSCSVMSL